MKKIAFEDLGSRVELVDRLDWGLMQWWDQNGCDAQLTGNDDENKSFKPNQIAPSIYIMIEFCFFSLDQ